MPIDLTRTVRRNTALLAAVTAVTSGSLQLVAALSSTTFVLATGFKGLLGLGPAIFLATAALAALPAGRAMDRFGRIPVIAAGFLVGTCGGVVTALSAGASSGPGVIAGFVLIGAATGTVLLSRTAAGDMYPPERRARGIALVLCGAVFGAILGPAVFGPLFSDIALEPSAFVGPWLASAAFMALGFVIVVFVRPDPKKIAALISPPPVGAPTTAAPLREILRRPGVMPALLAAFASYGVMVSVMNLTGYAVVHEHGHNQQDVFPIIGAHVFGMFALVLVVGTLVDRIGSTPVLVGGLALEAVSCAGLAWAESVPATAFVLFGLGLGWNLSFVAATTALVNRAAPAERGKLVGFNDLASGLFGASLALLGGYALEALGVVALAAGAATVALLPALFIARAAVWRRAEPERA
jgi:MFS family permease